MPNRPKGVERVLDLLNMGKESTQPPQMEVVVCRYLSDGSKTDRTQASQAKMFVIAFRWVTKQINRAEQTGSRLRPISGPTFGWLQVFTGSSSVLWKLLQNDPPWKRLEMISSLIDRLKHLWSNPIAKTVISPLFLIKKRTILSSVSARVGLEAPNETYQSSEMSYQGRRGGTWSDGSYLACYFHMAHLRQSTLLGHITKEKVELSW